MGEAEKGDKVNSGDKTTNKLDQFIALLKVIVWPFVVLIVYFQLRSPIAKAFDELPSLLAHSSELSVGSVSLKVQTSISNSGDPILADKLKGISEREFGSLLDLRTSSTYWVGVSEDGKEIWFPTNEIIGDWLDLRRRGLVELSLPNDDFQKILDSFPFSSKLGPGIDYRPGHPLTPEQTRQLRTQSVKLSDEGEKVVIAAVKLVINQLTDRASSPAKP